MVELLQRIHDWYICGPREFYKKNIDRFWQIRDFFAVNGEQNFQDMDFFSLEYATLDTELLEATRRTFDRVAKKY